MTCLSVITLAPCNFTKCAFWCQFRVNIDCIITLSKWLWKSQICGENLDSYCKNKNGVSCLIGTRKQRNGSYVTGINSVFMKMVYCFLSRNKSGHMLVLSGL